MAEGEDGRDGACMVSFLGGDGGGPATNAFIMHHEDLPNKEIYATNRMVHIIEEGPKE